MISLDEVFALEQRALKAWPAFETMTVGGWLFRFAGGYTKRANSANALRPAGSFQDVKTAAQAFYAKRGSPTIFRISPLAQPETDSVLREAGYALFDRSLVLLASLDRNLGENDGDAAVTIESAPSAEWLDGFAEANAVAASVRPVHDAIVRSIQEPAAFATLRQKRKAAGFGLGVCEAGQIGLFDIAVAPAERGRGFGRAITAALLRWGQQAGARTAYLQVHEVNATALGLYTNLGFVEAYRYHYRISTR